MGGKGSQARRGERRGADEAAEEEAEGGIPPPQVTMWVTAIAAQVVTVDVVDGPVLSLAFASGPFTAQVNMPIPHHEKLVAVIGSAVAAWDAEPDTGTFAGGVHLPGGVDIDAEATAMRQIKEGT